MGNKKKIVISLFFGVGLGMGLNRVIMKYCGRKKVEDTVISPNRFEVGFNLFNKWIKLKNEGKTLTPYFLDNEISTIAIYGMGALGERLFEELRSSAVRVVYAIDRNADSKHIEGLKIVGAEDELGDVDAIIVTPVQDYDAIEEKLNQRTDADIISLEDILDYYV